MKKKRRSKEIEMITIANLEIYIDKVRLRNSDFFRQSFSFPTHTHTQSYKYISIWRKLMDDVIYIYASLVRENNDLQ